MGKSMPTGNAAETQAVRQLRVQSSAYGLVIPLVYGMNRVAGNIIWADNFKAHRNVSGPSGGKAGGRIVQVEYTYTVSAMLALCEGPAVGIGALIGTSVDANPDVADGQIVGRYIAPGCWRLKRTLKVTQAQGRPSAGFDSFGDYSYFGYPALVPGTIPAQIPGDGDAVWDHLSGERAAAALTYPGIAYVAGRNLDLDSNASLPNFNFPVMGLVPAWQVYGYGGSIESYLGAAPPDIVRDLLLSTSHGLGWSASYVADYYAGTNSFAAWCLAAQILISPVYDAQQGAAQMLEELAEIAQAALVWSEGRLKIIPYADEPLTSTRGGITHTYQPAGGANLDGAEITPRYQLDDDDFLTEGRDDPPITVRREAPNDTTDSKVTIEFLNAANAYAPEVAEASDAATIVTSAGAVRTAPGTRYHGITEPRLAREVAQRQLQRRTSVRNTYRFSLPQRFLLLEPMDVVGLTDTVLGLLQYPVRITQVEEDDGRLQIEAEDLPVGVHSTASYISETSQSGGVDFNVDPGPTQNVVVFEPVYPLVTEPALWVAGWGNPAAWAGASVFLAEELDGPYELVGTLNGPSSEGVLADALPAVASPDLTSSPRVVLLSGSLLTGSVDDARALRRLCYVGHGNTYELISHSVATFLGAFGAGGTYQLGTYLERGVAGTAPLGHAVGTPFVRLDDDLVRIPLDPRLIGRDVFLKFVPHNLYGATVVGLDDVDPVYHRVAGLYLFSPLAPVTGLHATVLDGYTQLGWSAINDPRTGFGIRYEVRQGTIFAQATVLGTTTERTFRVRGGGTFWVTAFAIIQTSGGARRVYSETPDSLVISAPTVTTDVVFQTDMDAAHWPVLTDPYPLAILDAGAEMYFRWVPSAELIHDVAGTVPTASAGVIGLGTTIFIGSTAPYATWGSDEAVGGLLVWGTGFYTPFAPFATTAPLYRATPAWTLQWLVKELDTDARVQLDARSDFGLPGWRLLHDSTGKYQLEDGLGVVLGETADLGFATSTVRSLALSWEDDDPSTYPLPIATAATAVAQQRTGTFRLYVDGTLYLTVASGLIDMASPPGFAWRVNPDDPDPSIDGGFCVIHDMAWFRRALSAAELSEIHFARAPFSRPPGVFVDRLAGRVVSDGLTVFDSISGGTTVDGVATVDYLGGVSTGGRIYIDAAAAVQQLSAPASARPFTTASVYSLLPFEEFDLIGVVDDIVAVGETDAAQVQADAEFSVARALPAPATADVTQALADIPPFDPYRPYLPGALELQRVRWRYDFAPTEPGAIVVCDALVVGTDALPRTERGTGVSVGSGLDQLLAAGGIYGTGPTLTLVVPVDVPAGATVCVLVFDYAASGVPFVRTPTITDGVGTYTSVDPTGPGFRFFNGRGLFTRTLGAMLPAGSRITITQPGVALPVLAATAFSMLGVGAPVSRRDATVKAVGDPAAIADELGGGAGPVRHVIAGFAVRRSLAVRFAPTTGQELLPAGSPTDQRLTVFGAMATLPHPYRVTGILSGLGQLTESVHTFLASFAQAPAVTTVRFLRPFNTQPSVQCTIVDAEPGDLLVVSAVTRSTFNVEVRNAGAAQARVISWVATGD